LHTLNGLIKDATCGHSDIHVSSSTFSSVTTSLVPSLTSVRHPTETTRLPTSQPKPAVVEVETVTEPEISEPDEPDLVEVLHASQTTTSSTEIKDEPTTITSAVDESTKSPVVIQPTELITSEESTSLSDESSTTRVPQTVLVTTEPSVVVTQPSELTTAESSEPSTTTAVESTTVETTNPSAKPGEELNYSITGKYHNVFILYKLHSLDC
jgi:hypothetical protein